MFRCVTLTGADDSCSQLDLIRLSNEFPFLEFGILWGSHYGDRFPSWPWIEELVAFRECEAPAMQLSLHVCGNPLREIIAGQPPAISLLEMFKGFGRMQLNFHGEPAPDGSDKKIAKALLEMKLAGWVPEVIFQADGVNENLSYAARDVGINVSWLYDTSHGAGIMPATWRRATGIVSEGYAGGLGPDNIAKQMLAIYAAQDIASPNFDWRKLQLWVDMETKLFGDIGQFSIEACRAVAKEVSLLSRHYQIFNSR